MFSLPTAEPPLNFPPHRSHYVFVPVSGTVPTELTCDIEPGAARENYDIEWNRLNSESNFTRIREGVNPETFSLTLPVSANSNSAVYRCTVTIDHDGSGTGNPVFYDGARITIETAGKYMYTYICASSISAMHKCVNSFSLTASLFLLPALFQLLSNNMPNFHACLTVIIHVCSLYVNLVKGSSHADCSFSTVEPPLDFVSQRSHYVLVPGSGTVSTQLSCDIGPGAGREVQWNRLSSDGTFIPVTEGINQENFNLMLPVDVNSDSAVYRCTVTIDLGRNLRSYNGANITLRAAGRLPLLCASAT